MQSVGEFCQKTRQESLKWLRRALIISFYLIAYFSIGVAWLTYGSFLLVEQAYQGLKGHYGNHRDKHQPGHVQGLVSRVAKVH